MRRWHCPTGSSCPVSGSVGATLVGTGFLTVIGVGVLGSLLLASGLAFLTTSRWSTWRVQGSSRSRVICIWSG
jgi:hypothetical protein